jgi:CRP/FNR family transcriptional regulator, cyclic AMP receptor protein
MAEQLDEKYGVNVKKGDLIFCEYEPGSTVFFIKEGHVRISKIISNKEKTLAIIGPGDIFGEMAILESAPRSATATAEEDLRLLEFDKNSFAQLVKSQPAIAVKLLKLVALRINDQKRKLKIIKLPDTESKIMDVFLMLAENRRIDVTHTRNVNFEIKGDDIASWAGITIEDFNKTITHMASNKKVDLIADGYEVLNLYQFSRHVISKRKTTEPGYD